jgi:hypothetical protein
MALGREKDQKGLRVTLELTPEAGQHLKGIAESLHTYTSTLAGVLLSDVLQDGEWLRRWTARRVLDSLNAQLAEVAERGRKRRAKGE